MVFSNMGNHDRARICVYDRTGRLVMEKEFSHSIDMPVRRLTEGLYLYVIEWNGPFQCCELSFTISLISFRLHIQLYMFNALVVNNNFDLSDTWLTPEMYRIKVPSMVLWGRHDGTLPVALAYDAYNNLGTEENARELHIFEKSAHGCSFEEPELFIERITGFIEKYK
jgi:pimeloyl-ACP methyl ester carboxylesterase